MARKASFLKVIALFSPLVWATGSLAADPKAAEKSKSKAIQVYEASEEYETYTDVVKSVGPGDEYAEVLFKKRQGLHYAPKNQSTLELLVKSQKTGSSVTFQVDYENRIQGVELQESPSEDSKEEEKDLKKLMNRILGS